MCPLNQNPNRRAFHLMARPLIFDLRNKVGQGIMQNPAHPQYKRHFMNPVKLRCNNCNSLNFQEEKSCGTIDNPSFSICCNKKKFRLPPNPRLPDFLMFLLTSQTSELAKHFREKIRAYNSLFAFTSFGAKVIFKNIYKINI